ncbi:potassium channel family protein [Variovorax paradoxus]|uniref:potassium channel family protein n=1 Tax=Variovorax paradoxus TaxID=34073 RepID=UPI003F50E15A
MAVAGAGVLLLATAYFRWGPSDHTLKATERDLLEAAYFSFVTFTSLGYGDLSPIGFGRFVAVLGEPGNLGCRSPQAIGQGTPELEYLGSEVPGQAKWGTPPSQASAEDKGLASGASARMYGGVPQPAAWLDAAEHLLQQPLLERLHLPLPHGLRRIDKIEA